MDTTEKALVLDIGNSYTKMGLFIRDELAEVDAFPTEKTDLKRLEELLESSLDERLGELIAGVAVSSVVPAVDPYLRDLLLRIFGKAKLLWLERDRFETLSFDGLDFSAYQANALGTDRLANAVGGRCLFPSSKILVCDFGTTATFDLVESDGRFLGGAICPGPKKFQTLVNPDHAAQLFEVDVFQAPEITPGTSTQSSLENGLYYGYKGAILEIVGNLLQSAGWPLSQVHIVFTGGYAQPVRAMVQQEMPRLHVEPNLTLMGLNRLWRLNSASSAGHADRSETYSYRVDEKTC